MVILINLEKTNVKTGKNSKATSKTKDQVKKADRNSKIKLSTNIMDSFQPENITSKRLSISSKDPNATKGKGIFNNGKSSEQVVSSNVFNEIEFINNYKPKVAVRDISVYFQKAAEKEPDNLQDKLQDTEASEILTESSFNGDKMQVSVKHIGKNVSKEQVLIAAKSALSEVKPAHRAKPTPRVLFDQLSNSQFSHYSEFEDVKSEYHPNSLASEIIETKSIISEYSIKDEKSSIIAVENKAPRKLSAPFVKKARLNDDDFYWKEILDLDLDKKSIESHISTPDRTRSARKIKQIKDDCFWENEKETIDINAGNCDLLIVEQESVASIKSGLYYSEDEEVGIFQFDEDKENGIDFKFRPNRLY